MKLEDSAILEDRSALATRSVAHNHILATATSRAHVIQALLDLYDAPRYLEVGVWKGETFHAIRAKEKTGVDPKFRFDTTVQSSPGVRYVEKTSDEFFASHAATEASYEVIFLDGLHVFEQTARDLMSALDVLTADGIVVIDDVFPSSYSASLRSLAETYEMRTRSRQEKDAPDHWMGDVYKLVFFIEAFMPRLSYRTIEENHGETVLWRAPRHPADKPRYKTMRDIAFLEYKDAVIGRSSYRFAPFPQILSEIAAWKSRMVA